MSDTPITMEAYIASLRGTDHEIYGHLLRTRSRGVKTISEWESEVEALKSEIVDYDAPVRVVRLSAVGQPALRRR